MAAQYHSIFTEKGLELLRESIQSGTKLGITHMSFGDGNGALPTPNAAYTGMVKEVYRTQLNRLAPSKENNNWLEADGVIPSAVGGFNIREVGLWAGNTMVAYANYPPTYKPSGDQGTAQIKTIRIVLQIDNTANFELKIDASIVMATIQAVEDAKNEIYKNTVNTVKNISELLNLEVWDGRIVNVISYESDGLGGDFFTYDSTQANVNNGITIFNGWMRDLSDNYISTHDAGLKEDGTNHSDRFQLLLNCLSDNMTLEVFGKHLVNTAMLVTEKHNITVKFAEGAVLSAKELRDTFIFKGYQGQMPGSGARGILHFHKCNKPLVIRPLIRGCQKHNLNSAEPWEDGDSGVAFSYCTDPIVEYGDISHTTAWGVLAENSQNATAQHNKIYNVLRQSGLNLVVNGGGAKCLYNTISDVALYGIEWETATDSYNNKSIGNTVTRALKGEAAVRNVCELDSFGNKYIDCKQSMNSEISNISNSKLISFHDNTSINGETGGVFSDSGIVRVINNIIEKNENYPEYFITSAYNTLLSIINLRSFYVLNKSNLKVNSTIKINDIVYTITGISTIVDNVYKSDGLKIITVDKDLVNVRDMLQIYSKVTPINTHPFFTGGTNREVVISGNTVSGYDYCFKTDSNTEKGVTINEKLTANTFINCGNFLLLNGKNYGFNESANNLKNVGKSSGSFLNHLVSTAFTEKGSLNVFHKQKNDALETSKNYYFSQDVNVIAIVLAFPNADATTTGNVVLKIDGVDSISIPNASFNNTYNYLSKYLSIPKGNHTFKLVDTIGDLNYTEATISLLYS